MQHNEQASNVIPSSKMSAGHSKKRAISFYQSLMNGTGNSTPKFNREDEDESSSEDYGVD